MRTIDLSGTIVLYNFVVGVLVMLSSDKIASFAGNVGGTFGNRISRYTRISAFTFGLTIAVLSGLIYALFHIARLGVD